MSGFNVSVIHIALLKIPLLVAGAVSNHLGLTAPHRRRAEADEQKKFGSPSIVTGGAWFYFATSFAKGVVWASTLCEIAVILSSNFPSQVSDDVLSALVPNISFASLIRPTPIFLFGSLCACAGGLLRVWCHYTLGRFFTWDLAVRKEHKLITVGPYALVRHPSYLGGTILAIGDVLMCLGPGSWALECGILDTSIGKLLGAGLVLQWAVTLSLAYSRATKEDEVLKKEFGQEWQTWAQRTPYKIIPFIF